MTAKKPNAGAREDMVSRAFCLADEWASEEAPRASRRSGWTRDYTTEDEGLGEMPAEADDFFAPPKKKSIPKKPDGERAKRSAVNMLGYAACSERRLREKLARKGYARADIDTAIAYVRAKGLLNDARDAAHAVEYLANARLFGRRKIVETLYRKGYARNAIEAADWDALDFVAVCAEFLARHADTDADRETMIALARRRGFSAAEALAALRKLEDDGTFS